MVRLFVRVLDCVEKILRIFTSAFFVVMVASIAYQITLRYVFAKANSWSEELARYSFVWLVMLASALGTRHSRHMCIDFFIDKMSKGLKKTVELGTRLLAVVFFGVLVYKGKALCDLTMRQLSTGLEIPMAYAYWAIPIGASIMILFVIEDVIGILKEGRIDA